MAVLSALNYLMTTELYVNANLNIDETWLQNALITNQQAECSDDNTNEPNDCHNETDTFSEIDPVTCARYFNNRSDTFINKVLESPHQPIHKITDHALRVEFQHRGSPHMHMLLWAKDAPEYG